MVTARDLRVGNLVYIPKTDQIATVCGIIEFMGVQVNKNIIFEPIPFEEIKPIKLTEKILRSFYFEGNDMDMWIVLPIGNELELHIDCVREGEFEHTCLTQGRTEKGVPGKDYKFTYLKVCKNVHELQNLYHALTGKELMNSKHIK